MRELTQNFHGQGHTDYMDSFFFSGVSPYEELKEKGADAVGTQIQQIEPVAEPEEHKTEKKERCHLGTNQFTMERHFCALRTGIKKTFFFKFFFSC